MQTRRVFVAALLSAFSLLRDRPLRMRRDHPEPRAGIDASHVTPASGLSSHPDAVPVFDMVREIPQIVDGIRCQCGCGDKPERYSLLTCFEGEAPMGRRCEGCKAQARLVHRLHGEGKTLAEIRQAIDEEFGNLEESRR